MDEGEAKSSITSDFAVPRETMGKLEQFAELLRAANSTQNLVAAPSLESVWQRHFLDSVQLMRFLPSPQASCIDLGTGAGFPGLVIALLHPGPVTLVEERRLRVDFLRHVATTLGVDVEIIAGKAQRIVPRPFDVISARAFAPLERLLELGSRFSTAKTRWILPKGRNAQSELDVVESSWQGDFRLENSLTDAEARIIVAEGVERAGKRKRR